MTTTSKQHLWVRCGDGDGYNEFGDDLSAVAAYLAEMNVRGPLARCNELGVSADGLHDWNYISLYWGDEAAQPVRGLSAAELAILDRELSQGEQHGWQE